MQQDQKSQEEMVSEKSIILKQMAANGAKKRNSNLSPERRAEIARQAGLSKGKKGMQKATHQGVLSFGASLIDCYVLSDGTRIVSVPSVGRALGLSNPAAKTIKKAAAINLPFFLAADALKPYLSSIFKGRPESISFIAKNGQKTQGVEAKLLPDICEAYLRARQDGCLPPQQLKTAIAAEIIIMSLAKVGIIALVDESTGFQEERARDELQTLLKTFVREDLLKWAKRFPHSFFRETYRILGWKYRPGQCHGPGYLGTFINKYVYEAISSEVHEELKTKNPVLESGKRVACFHQFLTEDVGLPALDKHLVEVVTLLKLSKTKEEFDSFFKRLFPGYESNQLDFIDSV